MSSLPADTPTRLAVGTTEMGNGSVTSHRQIAASILGTRADSVDIINADTDLTPYDTGTFASTGTVVAGQAVALTATALRDNILSFAGRYTEREPADCSLEGGEVVCGNQRIALKDLHVAGTAAGHRFEAKRRAYLSPRSVPFTVHGVRLAVHRVTGEIRILHSVHAADIGRLINPMQCRGQIEGGVAQSLGATLYEELLIDGTGRPVNPTFRDYHVPAFADIPRLEVYFADTTDAVGPYGAKSMSESPYNPVAAALGNALRDATGIRFKAVPFRADRVLLKLAGYEADKTNC